MEGMHPVPSRFKFALDTGVGLAVILATLLGGYVWIDSRYAHQKTMQAQEERLEKSIQTLREDSEKAILTLSVTRVLPM